MNRYINIPQTKIKGKLVYKTVRYPEVPLSSEDIYVYTQQGDRFDVLARQYYQDSSLWWVIAIGNPQVTLGSLLIPSGLQLRIPAFPTNVVNEYNTINK
jgi:phage tail protein X